MAKRDIHPLHFENMNAMLVKLQTVLDVDVNSINNQLSSGDLNKYPKAGQSLVINALNTPQQQIFRPYQGVMIVASAPHYLKLKVPYIEFALIKASAIPGAQYEMPFAWAVFEGERQIMTVSGLVLDNRGEKSAYEKNSLYGDRRWLPREAHQKIADMIKLFPLEEGSRESEFAFDAVADLLRA